MNALKLMLAKKNREVDATSWERLYESLIIKKIRKRYSVNQELAILRQRDTKPSEFSEYNSFVELCKAEVKTELGIF
jgi:hypothetical protein